MLESMVDMCGFRITRCPVLSYCLKALQRLGTLTPDRQIEFRAQLKLLGEFTISTVRMVVTTPIIVCSLEFYNNLDPDCRKWQTSIEDRWSGPEGRVEVQNDQNYANQIPQIPLMVEYVKVMYDYNIDLATADANAEPPNSCLEEDTTNESIVKTKSAGSPV